MVYGFRGRLRLGLCLGLIGLSAVLWPGAARAQSMEAPSYAIRYVVTETTALNVRERPSIHGEIVARVERGEAVRVIRMQGGWALIDGVSEAGEGWVSGKYLAEQPPFQGLPSDHALSFTVEEDDPK